MTDTVPTDTGSPPVPAARDPLAVVGAGAAVLLATAAVSAVVQGGGWFAHAAVVVAVVTAVGLLPARVAPAVVVAAQGVAWLAVMVAMFTTEAAFGMLPGPAALAELGALLDGARSQIGTGFAPVPATPEILLVSTGAIGLVAIVVQAVAVGADAPTVAGGALLVVFAVPTALADGLLPWWALAGAVVGFGVLLTVRSGARHRIAGGAVLVAAALAAGLLAGTAAPVIGTAGRLGPGGGASAGAIGLSPFTSLRGQLEQPDRSELFRVRGLPEPTYLRALTLREYVPDTGWRAGRPDQGPALPGPVPVPEGTAGGGVVPIEITNVGFRDYWLPVYGVPESFSGLPPDTWAYDTASGTAYASRPREQAGWAQSALLVEPSAETLRAGGSSSTEGDGSAEDAGRPPAAYLDTRGVDPRVAEIAATVAGDASTDFDRALALTDWFTGPGSEFTYSLATAPGGGDDALVEFLTVGRVGYCEQYASAMAVMLRALDVPARVAVGFTGGTDAGPYRSVSTADAHAWVEAWIPGNGWTLFDPTPLTDGRGQVPEYVQEARGRGADDGAELDAQALEGDDVPLPEPAAPQGAPQDADPTATPAPAGGGAPPLWPLPVAAAAVLALGPAGWRRIVRSRRLAAVAAGGADAATAAWAEVLAESVDRHIPVAGGDIVHGATVRATARRLVREHGLDPAAQEALREIVVAVETSWYGAESSTPGSLEPPVRIVLGAVIAASPLSLGGWLLPRSVLGSARLEVTSPPDAQRALTPARSGGENVPPSGP